MATSNFDRALLPPAHSFYERELGRLTRPSRGWARANCPFHQSKSHTSLSINLDSGGFFCHGCGVKGGDVVAFVRLRNRCSFNMACETLGIRRGSITPAERVEITRRQQDREAQQQREAERKEVERHERLRLREHLHAVDTLYREAIQEHDWQLMSELLPRLREVEAAYCRDAGLDSPYE